MREEAFGLTSRADARDFDLLGRNARLDQRLMVRCPQVEPLLTVRPREQARSIGERLDYVLTDGVAARTNSRADSRDDVPWVAAQSIAHGFDRRARGAHRAAAPTGVDCRHYALLGVGQQDRRAVGVAQHQRLVRRTRYEHIALGPRCRIGLDPGNGAAVDLVGREEVFAFGPDGRPDSLQVLVDVFSSVADRIANVERLAAPRAHAAGACRYRMHDARDSGQIVEVKQLHTVTAAVHATANALAA